MREVLARHPNEDGGGRRVDLAKLVERSVDGAREGEGLYNRCHLATVLGARLDLLVVVRCVYVLQRRSYSPGVRVARSVGDKDDEDRYP